MQVEGTFLDENHLKTIEILLKTEGNVKKAAENLGIERQTIYNQLYRIREIRKKAKTSANIINNWMKKPSLRKYIY